MRRGLIIICVLATALASATAALAITQTAHSGPVSATFDFTRTKAFPGYKALRLTISQSGTVVYSQPVVGTFCGKLCAPAATRKQSSVHVLDLARRPARRLA